MTEISAIQKRDENRRAELIGAAAAGALLGISIVFSVFLGVNLGDLAHQTAAMVILITCTAVAGILGLYFAYKFIPEVRDVCHNISAAAIRGLRKLTNNHHNRREVERNTESIELLRIRTEETRLTNIRDNKQKERS